MTSKVWVIESPSIEDIISFVSSKPNEFKRIVCGVIPEEVEPIEEEEVEPIEEEKKEPIENKDYDYYYNKGLEGYNYYFDKKFTLPKGDDDKMHDVLVDTINIMWEAVENFDKAHSISPEKYKQDKVSKKKIALNTSSPL